MRALLVFIFVLLSIVPKCYAGFRVHQKLATASQTTIGVRVPSVTVTDGGKHKKRSAGTHFYHGHRFLPNNVIGLLAFIASLIGAVSWVLFFKMLKGAAMLPWQYLAAGTAFGVLALVLGLNTPRSYFYDLGILAIVFGLVESIPLLPLFLVFALVAWLVYLPKRQGK